MEPAKGIEPPTYGLRNRVPTVHPVRNKAFSIGYGAPHSGTSIQFVHHYAPYYAPHASHRCRTSPESSFCGSIRSPVMTDYLDEVAGNVGKTGSPAGRGLSCVRSTTSDIGFDNWFPSNFDCRKKPICRSFCIKCCRQHLMREIRQSASKRRVKACWDSIGYPGQRFGRKRTRT
jgi:hypothetical protein